jgi:hypothetical protein
MIRMKSSFMLRMEKMLTSIRTLLDVLFFLAAGGATRDLLAGVHQVGGLVKHMVYTS